MKTTTTTTTTTQKKRAPLADRFVGRSRRKTFDEREGIYRHGGGAVVVVVVDGGVDVVFCTTKTTTTTTTTQCNEKESVLSFCFVVFFFCYYSSVFFFDVVRDSTLERKRRIVPFFVEIVVFKLESSATRKSTSRTSENEKKEKQKYNQVRKRNPNRVGVNLITAASGFIFPAKILSNAFMENHFHFRRFLLGVCAYNIIWLVGYQRRRRGRFVHVRLRNNHEVVL